VSDGGLASIEVNKSCSVEQVSSIMASLAMLFLLLASEILSRF
jgi:hypothetical protein